MKWCALILIFTLIECYLCRDDYMLPNTVKPTHYDLKFITHLNDTSSTPFKFSGEVIITLKILEKTKKIHMHNKGLKIFEDQIKLEELTSKELVPIKGQKNHKYDILCIKFTKELEAGKQYILSIKYEGNLEDNLIGYYRSSYVDRKSGERKWMSVTQFEPISARAAFPCFDEPALKAVFKITMGHRKEYTALSNMPVKNTIPMKNEPDWIWDEFEESVPMSTYLVAFALTDFAHEKSADGNVAFRTWARKDAIEQVNFAKETGPAALSFYSSYFNISYPLPKMDQIAIPDFNSGAMENWGLVTYRETALLFDPQASSLKSKARVAEVVAHELAHQWFGNLVTMKWWTDLWLNEGFATYMAAIAVNKLFPKWNALDVEITENLLSVYDIDSLKASHPISVPIGNPEKISEIFDHISYKKGFFILHMMSQFLGEDVLRQGVSNYLKEYKFSNAVQDDLWRHLTQEAHKQGTIPNNLTVKAIMDGWTLVTGYPLLTITQNCSNKTATIRQERYLQKSVKGEEDTKSCWRVPISYTTQKHKDFTNQKPQFWLSCEDKEKIIDVACDGWVVANIGASGLYAVNYDEENWKMLAQTLNSDSFKEIGILNRVVLIDNVLSLAKTGHVPYDTAFDVISYLRREDEYLPWRAAMIKLSGIKSLLATTPAYGEFKKFMKDIVTPIYTKLLTNEDSHEDKEMLNLSTFKQEIAQVACDYDVGNCVENAKEQFSVWKLQGLTKSSTIPTYLRPAYYCTAIQHGNEEDWDFLWSQYLNSNVQADKIVILNSLGCSKDTWILSRYLEWSLNEKSGIRKQDSSFVFGSVVRNDDGYFVAKRFFKDNIKNIYRRSAPIYHKLGRLVQILARRVITETEEKELTTFLEENKHYLNSSKLAISQVEERISANTQWYKKNKLKLNNVLSNLRKTTKI